MDGDLQASGESQKEVEIVMEEARGISAANLILKYADDHGINLIVMGTHGRRGLGYMFLGSIAQEVVRRSSCPVFTVREMVDKHPGIHAQTARENGFDSLTDRFFRSFHNGHVDGQGGCKAVQREITGFACYRGNGASCLLWIEPGVRLGTPGRYY